MSIPVDHLMMTWRAVDTSHLSCAVLSVGMQVICR